MFAYVSTGYFLNLAQRFDTEINTWLSVQGHPNILEFIGLYEHDDDPNTLLGLVSPFRDEGDLIEYLPKHKLNYRPLVCGRFFFLIIPLIEF
jgi:serine/threonine protein kinase